MNIGNIILANFNDKIREAKIVSFSPSEQYIYVEILEGTLGYHWISILDYLETLDAKKSQKK